MFLDKIIDQDNRKKNDIEYLLKSNLPNLMYGVGSYAKDVTNLLNKCGVKIDAAFVDAEYFESDNCFIDGIKVTTIEDICNIYDQFNVIIGFANYKRAKNRLININGVVSTILIDAPHNVEFFNYQYIKDNIVDFNYTYNLLRDQLSKDTFIAYINAKISGQPDELYDLVDRRQYFNNLILLGKNESFIDCGAYDGDTILNFLKETSGEYAKIYAFEPDESNYLKLQQVIVENQIKHIESINKGCWDSKTILRTSSDANMTSLIHDQGNSEVEVDTIDNIVNGDRVTFLKMDIEGAELAALRGAEKTIKESKPNLAISVYHEPEDLVTIPQYISCIVPDYKFFLRQHQYISWETILYAII